MAEWDDLLTYLPKGEPAFHRCADGTWGVAIFAHGAPKCWLTSQPAWTRTSLRGWQSGLGRC